MLNISLTANLLKRGSKYIGLNNHLSSSILRSSSISQQQSSSSSTPLSFLPSSFSTTLSSLSSFYSTNNNNNGKYYSLSQFPYPSGNLHMGHVRVYTMSDCVARLKRMQGYEVVHPMGWDAFGLPAENAAIEKNVSPSKWTNANIDEMRRQFKLLDLEFDWDRELSTCDPSYYRWTQEIFLRLYKAGLASRKIAIVNWDPVDQTVLANEQVDATGRSWRSNALVERREMKQWYFHITKYADRLADDLQKLDGWPDEVKNMQRDWIGRSHGYLLDFQYKNQADSMTLTAFSTRPETIYGVTFLSVHGKHPVMQLVRKRMSAEKIAELDDFITRCANLKLEDPIIAFDTGASVVSPFGSTVRLVVSSAVHADYGTGCVMGVPAHNTVDHQVATELSIPYLYVLERPNGLEDNVVCYDQLDQSTTLKNSGQFNGMRIDEAIKLMVSDYNIRTHTSYRIRDWLLSRQRYWGTPIPIIHCDSCGEVPVPSDQLPVILPTDISFTGKGSLLNSLEDWKNCKCPKCGGKGQRETDTMDTFVDSSWYYLRFLDNQNQKEIFNKEIVNRLMPVDVYVGGIEHAILHLLYSRFITKFLKDDGLLDHEEPFKVLLIQGLVKAKTYRDSITNKPLRLSEVNNETSSQPVSSITGNPVNITVEKMSKSKFNGIEPHEMISQYGSDVLKLYILFKAPPEKSLEWDTEGIEGCRKWLKRVETLVKSFVDEYKNNKQSFIGEFGKVEAVKQLRYETHSTIDNVTQSIEKYTFNTGIAFLMTLSNTLAKVEPSHRNSLEFYESIRSLVVLLAAFAPNSAQDYWKLICENGPSFTSHSSGDSAIFEVRRQSWPTASRECLEQRVKQLVIMTNGKTRAVLDVTTDDQKELEKIAIKQLGNRLDGQTIVKTFFATTKSNNYTINLVIKK